MGVLAHLCCRVAARLALAARGLRSRSRPGGAGGAPPNRRALPAGRRAVSVAASSAVNNVDSGVQPGLPGTLGAAAAAAQAVVAVSQAVRERGIQAPDDAGSLVARRSGDALDEDGLPLSYDRAAIQAFWDSRPQELQSRWLQFLGLSVPFITKLVQLVLMGGTDAVAARDGELARDARVIMEQLGPTYTKVGQMMSVRPDVLGPKAMAELALLQDAVPRFDSDVARSILDEELGRPWADVFSELSPEPIAAASLAQVYRGRLIATGEEVAVKIQRPGLLPIVSKDLYVLRRAAEIYQGLMDRLAPNQRTDYVGLLNEFAVGFYTELDFLNEADSQETMRGHLADLKDIYVPRVYRDLCSRRLLVSEWVDGVKLTTCSQAEIKELLVIGQEAFLRQLLVTGFFHADPHPGNLLKLTDPAKGKLALLDFGLVARLKRSDQDGLISAVVHLANRDYSGLVDDFVALAILPPDTDRAAVEPLMDRVLGPYVAGGGGLRGAMAQYGSAGGLQQMTRDLTFAMRSVPFSIPPYFALLARAVATLEGIALQGDPEYKIVMASYPFVARQLLREGSPGFRRALAEILYARTPESGTPSGTQSQTGLRGRRLAALLAAGMNQSGAASPAAGAFIDLDALPEEGVSPWAALRFLLSPAAQSLRESFLIEELVAAGDLLARQTTRRAARALELSLSPRPPPFLAFLPSPPPPPVVVPAAWLLPGLDWVASTVRFSTAATVGIPDATVGIPDATVSIPTGAGGSTAGAGQAAAFPPPAAPARASPTFGFFRLEAVLAAAAPALTQTEELYARSLSDALAEIAGPDASALLSDPQPMAVLRALVAAARSGRVPGLEGPTVAAIAAAAAGVVGGEGAAVGPAEAHDALTAEERATAAAVADRVGAALAARLRRRLVDGLELGAP